MKKSAKKAGKNTKIVTKNNKKLPIDTIKKEDIPACVFDDAEETVETPVEETVAVAEEAPLETEVKDDAPVQEETDEEIAEPTANDSEAPAPLSVRVPLLNLSPEPTYRELLSALSSLLGVTLYETLPNDACYELIEIACAKYGVAAPARPMALPIIVFCVNSAIEVYNGRN